MPKYLEAAQESLRSLNQTRNAEAMLKTLEHTLSLAHTHLEFQTIATRLFPMVPTNLLQENSVAATLYARTLCGARQEDSLLEFAHSLVGQPDMAGVGVYMAWALIRKEQYLEAELLLRTVEVRVPQAQTGLFWRFLAEALGYQKKERWKEAFAKARLHLRGEALGRCLLEEAALLHLSGAKPTARAVWSEALAHLGNDPYYLAWGYYNLGISLLAEHPHQAEAHLLKAEQVSRYRAARGMQCRVLCGLGALRRSLGEYVRATDSYRQAIKSASKYGDAEDWQLANWGLGHTLRVSGQVEDALVVFWEGLEKGNPGWLHMDIAAAQLMLGDDKGAQASLLEAKSLKERHFTLAPMVRAELARRTGDEAAMLRALEGVNLEVLWAREERHCFPRLFDSPAHQGRAVGAGIQPGPTVVEVRAAGVLQVWVNSRPIALKPSGKTAELLVLLLEGSGHGRSAEELADAMYPQDGQARRNQTRKKIWQQVEKLRHELGWKDSVMALEGSYRLDPSARWHYDLASGMVSPSFMQGVYSNWAEERRQQMQAALETRTLN